MGRGVNRRAVAPLVVLVAALAYPVAVLSGGSPRFPTRAECIHPPKEGVPLEAVFGRYDHRPDAESRLQRVLAAGFKGSKIEPDGCGGLKVDVAGVPNLAVGRDLVAEAQKVGISATLQAAQP
jgi:hypothetical protein